MLLNDNCLSSTPSENECDSYRKQTEDSLLVDTTSKNHSESDYFEPSTTQFVNSGIPPDICSEIMTQEETKVAAKYVYLLQCLSNL